MHFLLAWRLLVIADWWRELGQHRYARVHVVGFIVALFVLFAVIHNNRQWFDL